MKSLLPQWRIDPEWGGPVIGYVFGFILVVGAVTWSVIVRPGSLESTRSITVLIVVSGGLIGWLLGMLLTPVDDDETKKFRGYMRAGTAFIAGWLAGKLEKLFDLYSQDPNKLDELAVKRLLAFGAMLLFGALSTYVWRHYLTPMLDPNR
jgi:hypothetical protein